MSGLEQSRREIDEVCAQSEEAVNALLAYLPITQTEIERLDTRIDSIEEA